MKRLLALLLLCSFLHARAQTRAIAHFSVWQPLKGQENQFEEGYKKHLQWHAANKDTWGWYGWYVISGPRAGYFIDATFDHAWSDFDKPVNPAGDAADNDLNTEPYGDFKLAYKVKFVPRRSISDGNSLQSPFLRMITLTVTNLQQGMACVEKVKNSYTPSGGKHFLVYQLVDGGPLNTLVLLIGSSSFEALGATDNLYNELSNAAGQAATPLFTSIVSETLRYRADMSWFPGK